MLSNRIRKMCLVIIIIMQKRMMGNGSELVTAIEKECATLSLLPSARMSTPMKQSNILAAVRILMCSINNVIRYKQTPRNHYQRLTTSITLILRFLLACGQEFWEKSRNPHRLSLLSKRKPTV